MTSQSFVDNRKVASMCMTGTQNISLYIPHVFDNYNKEMITKVFDDLEIGEIDHIDFVSKMGPNGKVYNAAYIHFDHWYDTITARNFQDRVQDPEKEAKIMYEDPWYWIVLENKGRKFASGDRKPCIVLDEPVKTQVDEVKQKQENDDTVSASPTKCTWAQKTAMVLDRVFSVKKKEEPFVPMDFSEEEIAEIENAIDNQYHMQLDDNLKMYELEQEMEIDDEFLISIDSRYVQTIEQENAAYKQANDYLKMELCRLQNAYQMANNGWYTETVKTQALASAIQIINK
jgi:hypothetical protein